MNKNEQDEFATRFGFSDRALRRLGIRFTGRRPLMTAGMIRRANGSVKITKPLAELGNEELRDAIYGYATLVMAGRRVDEVALGLLREEAERRAT